MLLWYFISLFFLVSGAFLNHKWNEEGIRKKKWHHRHGFGEEMTDEQKNKIKYFKKADIGLGDWTFLLIKVSTALFFEIAMLGISFFFECDTNNEGRLFTGILFDTLAVTVAAGYYNIVLDAASGIAGIKNKIWAILNVFEGNLARKVFWHLVSLALLGCAVIYSFNEFTLYAPGVLGISYVIFLAVPIKDTTVKR